MAYDDSDIPYIYEQDKRIDRAMRHYDNIDETLINLHRVIFCSSKPVFSEMIKATIFGEEDNFSITQKIELSARLAKAIFDISKTKFL